MNVLGVGVIRDFAFAMNVGVIVGTYSSIFIAEPDPHLAQRQVHREPEAPGAGAQRAATRDARSATNESEVEP